MLRTAIRQGLQLVVADAIYIIGGGERATIDGLGVGLDEQSGAIGTHDVTIHLTDLSATGGGCIEQHAYLFAGFKRVSNNLLTIAANLRVGLAIGQGVNGADGLTAELALGNVGERNLLASRSTHSQRQRHAKRE